MSNRKSINRLAGVCLAAFGLCCAAHAATVTVSSFKGTVYGPGEATLAFTGVDAAQELWVAWDDADKGEDIAQWKESERLDVIASGATSATYTLPADARAGRAARFFLFPSGGTYPTAYIRATGTQYINTGVYPDPHTAASMTFLLDDMDTRQQRTFGVGNNTNGFVFVSYINGSGQWAWAARDHFGNWTGTGNLVLHRRATITLDAHNNLYKLEQEDLEDYTGALTSVASVNGYQTLTSSLPLLLLAYNSLDGTVTGYGRMRVYSSTVSLTNNVVRNYTPYVQAGEAGLMETVHNQFCANDGTGAFIPGGRGDGTGGAASDLLDLTTARSEDVFADAYIWMRGMAIDKNGNTILENNEMTNSINTVAFPSTVYGATGHRPVISNELVRLPGRGVGRQMQTLYFPQDVVWTNEAQTLGKGYPCSVTCGTPLTGFDSHYTWIMRFRPDFSAPMFGNQWMLGFGYGASRGMMFGPAESSTTRRTFRIYTTAGSWSPGESFVISNGCGWVDFAVTVDGQKLTAYLIKDGPTQPSGNVDIANLRRATTTYASTVNLVPNPGTVLRFGTESPQNGTYAMPAPSSGNNPYKTFRGSIQQFACWKRTLTEQEILAAFGWPRAETWRVGIENDATTELSVETAPEGGFAVDGETWPVPNGGLAGGASVSFRFPGEAGYDDGRAQIFRWKTTSDSGEGMLGVSLNGKSLGARTVKAGAWQSWFVPAAALTVGTNVLTVARIDSGTGVVKLDAAAFGGGWQVGKKDDDWTDFIHESPPRDEYFVVDGNFRHVPRVMLSKTTGNRPKSRQWWHAVMPRSLAGEYDWILHFRTPNYGNYSGNILAIDLNGTRIFTKSGTPAKTTFDVPISREQLPAGENVFSFAQVGTGTYVAIDSVWLEPVAPPSGTFLIMR
ncbi:MAG: hypothetical protein IJI36_04780 [Kiritimatiellae bacterium]|nr:hypothetical protein [Kiritimatiellia bacterium]